MTTQPSPQRLGADLRVVSAAVFGALLITPAVASAQTGISEADVIQAEEEAAQMNEEDPSVANERDALSNRPTVIITRPDVPVDGDAARLDDAALFGGRLRPRINVLTKFVSRNNLDFRALEESSNLSVFDTDDRLTYGANQARVGVEYFPVDSIEFDVGLGHNGLWGGDSLRNLNNTNTLFVDTLHFEWTPVDTDAFSLTTRVGRQYFEIGGAGYFGGAKRDYFFWDVVDGVTIDADFGAAGRLRILGVDTVGLQYRPDEVDFVTRQETGSADLNFRGDSTTYRYGGIYELVDPSFFEGFEARAFGFYADIGGGERGETTGSDLCYGGSLCNVPDNDYNWMAGTRIGYFYGDRRDDLRFGAYGEYARSGGIDRKDERVGREDILATGNAYGVGLSGFARLSGLTLDAGAQFFRADGGSYSGGNGQQFNYGFVGFKGAHIGGVGIDDNAGWHPTPYIGSAAGVEDDPQEQRRKSGTQVIHAGFGVGFINTFKLSLGWWNLQDTNSTNLDPSEFEEVAEDLPFGYGQADIFAQERLGRTLGNEFDLGLTYLASDILSIFVQGGVFLPGNYYEVVISRGGGTAFGSEDPQPFWAVTGGMALEIY